MHYTQDYLDDVLVRIAYHSSGIEGNTISLPETVSIILENTLPSNHKSKKTNSNPATGLRYENEKKLIKKFNFQTIFIIPQSTAVTHFWHARTSKKYFCA